MKQIIRVFLLFGFYFTSALYAPPKERQEELQVRMPSASNPGTPVESADPDERELQQLDLDRSTLDLDELAQRLSAYLASPVMRMYSMVPMEEAETVEALDMLPGSPCQLRGEDSDLQANAEDRELPGGAASSSRESKKESKK